MNTLYRYALGITSQFYFCGVPFRLDSYQGCTYQCAYCFVHDRGGQRHAEVLRPADVQLVARLFQRSEGGNRHANPVVQCLSHRVPIHFGGMSDPFLASDPFATGWKLLEIVNSHDYPVIISTKSDLVVRPDYLELLADMKNLAVQLTIITDDEELSRRLEVNTPSCQDRLKAISVLSARGIWVACRLQPLIPEVNTSCYSLIDQLADAGCRHVIIEHYKMPTDSSVVRRRKLDEAINVSLRSLYYEWGAVRRGRELELPPEKKLEYLSPLVARIKKCGMTYGAADNDFHHTGDTMCCCGIDDLPGFENWYKHNYRVALHRAPRHGRVIYELIKSEWFPMGNVNRWINSDDRLRDVNGHALPSNTRDYLLSRWNSPDPLNSPGQSFAVEKSTEVDSEGNRAYQFIADRRYLI